MHALPNRMNSALEHLLRFEKAHSSPRDTFSVLAQAIHVAN